jgi:hypothetical protein
MPGQFNRPSQPNPQLTIQTARSASKELTLQAARSAIGLMVQTHAFADFTDG